MQKPKNNRQKVLAEYVRMMEEFNRVINEDQVDPDTIPAMIYGLVMLKQRLGILNSTEKFTGKDGKQYLI